MVSWLSSDSRACRWQSIIVSVQWDTRGARKKRARNEELWRRPNWGLITRSSRNSAISGCLKHASFPPLLFEWERDEAREKKSKRKRGKERRLSMQWGLRFYTDPFWVGKQAAVIHQRGQNQLRGDWLYIEINLLMLSRRLVKYNILCPSCGAACTETPGPRGSMQHGQTDKDNTKRKALWNTNNKKITPKRKRYETQTTPR